MNLYLSLYKNGLCDKPYRSFTKEVAWLAPPPKDEIFFVGQREDGARAGINAHVRRIAWDSDGTITVEASIVSARDEYDDLSTLLLADGFVLAHDFA